MPGVLSPPGIGPSSLGRYQPPRNTILPSPSIIIPVGVDGHVEPAAQGTAVTTALPTGITDGDLVLIEVSHGSGGPPGTTITTPAGWTLLSNLDDGSTKLPTFWRFFVTGDTAPSFTLGTSRSWCTHSTAFRYVDPFHPFGPLDLSWQQTAQPSGATYTSGTLTPYDAGAMLVVCWGGKVAAGVFQTITTAAGWGQTAPINQSSIAAVTNVWAHFQYKPLGVPVATSEVVTISNSAVGQGIILALRPLGSATPIGYGTTSTALHPGQGPSNARFWQSARATDISSGATPISLSDAGSADDQLTVAASVPLSDTGTAADALTVAAAVSLSDVGTAADSITIAAAVPLAETATATDALAATAAVPLAETGAAADTLAVAGTIPLADTAAADDQLTIQTPAAFAVGLSSTGFHPGRGPTTARFYQTARSTEIAAGFSVGVLTAADASSATLTTSAATAVLTASDASGQLTATDTSTGTLTTREQAGGPS